MPPLAGSGELRVTLQGAAGQRTVWSVAGHRSRGWQGAVVPVQSPAEFQVSGATQGCRVSPGMHQPPRPHLPPQISFEITTRRWPMEGTVALDDIVYSTRVGCHSSPESPVEGAGKGGRGRVCSSGCERSTQSCPGCWAEAGGNSLGSGSSLTAFPPPAEKPSGSFGSFVAEVVLGVLLALVIVALMAAWGWYWLKQRRLASRTPIESNSSQGFDNITFRDVRIG